MPPTSTPAPLAELARQFALSGEFVAGAPHGHGHINDTFAVTVRRAGGPGRYILQRINRRIFRDVPGLMENIRRVTEHIARKLAAGRASGDRRQALRIIPARSGGAFHRDERGDYWRCYNFIERARSHDILQDPAQAFAAAAAFGAFQGQLADLAGPRLGETIPHFHDTPRRFAALRAAVQADAHGRRAAARAEIKFAFARESTVGALFELQARGAIPERIAHHDAKLNNVLLDEATGLAVCVVDLDTVMPGLALYDFGDLARSATNSAAEDETDLARVQLQLPIFAALASGYLSSARAFLRPSEIGHLVFSARLCTFETGVRFLTDFLEGDGYYKTSRPGHNLDRARCQFQLLRSMEAQADEMNRLVDRSVAAVGGDDLG